MSFLAEAFRKADAWGMPLCLFSLDVTAAFDHLRPDVLGGVLATRGASPCLIAAAVRENVGLSMRPHLAFAEGSRVPLQRGMRQGGSRTPQAWNHVVA